jgi:hypothetical protein
MTSSLSLYTIEDGLAELLNQREEARADVARGGSEEDRAEAENALAVIERTLGEYLSLEVRKVDNYHRYLTCSGNLIAEMKAEETAIRTRRQRLEAAMAWLKERALTAMSIADKKRVDGTAGRYLMRKGNGGVKPLVVDSWDGEHWTNGGPLTSVLPEAMMDVTVTLPLPVWLEMCDLHESFSRGDGGQLRTETVPNNARIRAALEVGIVPGARLAERGEHLECR